MKSGDSEQFATNGNIEVFLQTIKIQVSQLVTWDQHCLPFSYQHIPKLLLHETEWSRPILKMRKSTLGISVLKEFKFESNSIDVQTELYVHLYSFR